MKKIYLDTSVISAYWDERKPERQRVTQIWWKEMQKNYEVYISEIVEAEIFSTPDEKLRKKLFDLIKNIKSLRINPDVRKLANEYVRYGIFDVVSFRDALHIATATINNIDIVVSWNFAHIVNYETKCRVNAVNLLNGYQPIEIYSPFELGGGRYV
jgi:predicted nucleic acid-binding protein